MVASFIGNITASLEAVPFGKLYYRHLEWCKTVSLKSSRFNFDASCNLNTDAMAEVQWWVDIIENSYAKIRNTPEIDRVIHTDASKDDGGGWGASDGTFPDINGRWSLTEQVMHINILELKAIKFAIMSYLPIYKSCAHVRIMSDNATAIAYINKQGGTHCMIMHKLAVEIWEFCMARKVHITAAHIPGVHNTLADVESRKFHDSAEWAIPGRPGASKKSRGGCKTRFCRLKV